jgi:tripartite-type tricarboxylate transporter receptor subunit TctC
MKRLLFVLLMTCLPAWAWTPQEEIQLVVPFPPGGSTDVVGRIVADALSRQGLKVIVINKAGAGGSIGTNQVIESRGNGYTMLLTGTSFVFNKVNKSAGTDYDVNQSLVHVALIGTVENHVYANNRTVPENLATVVENMRTGRRDYSWGVTNPGAEFTARMIQNRVDLPIKIVPYKGSAPAVADLLGGHIDFVIDSGSSESAHASVKTGNTRLIATVNTKNSKQTTLDQYLPGVVTQSWFGISLPRGATPDIVRFYEQAVQRMLQDPDTKRRLDAVLLKNPGNINFAQLIDNDFKKYSALADKR